uniref:Uncharacterized protein n=1 Tax=Cucumis melo TaxID=3656 RepID=A0A9I9EJT9_CUCME
MECPYRKSFSIVVYLFLVIILISSMNPTRFTIIFSSRDCLFKNFDRLSFLLFIVGIAIFASSIRHLSSVSCLVSIVYCDMMSISTRFFKII